jgi:hypothetical protein
MGNWGTEAAANIHQSTSQFGLNPELPKYIAGLLANRLRHLIHKVFILFINVVYSLYESFVNIWPV